MVKSAKPKRASRKKPANQPRPGRPRIYGDKDFIALLERMGDEGKTLLVLCKESGIAYSTARKRINESSELSALYAICREEYAHTRVQQLDEIASSAKTSVDVQRARLRCDIIKWEVAKVLPKIYGDRMQIDQPAGLAITIHESGE